MSIVGGGTAGWLCALFVQKFLPDVRVTLIESEKIGILGAGEGTTPGFSFFLKQVNIDESDFIKETGATIKWGVDFINWGGDNTSYKHDFFTGEHAFHFDAKKVATYFKKIATERGLIHIIGDITNIELDDNEYIKSIVLESSEKIDTDFVMDCSGFRRLIIGDVYKPNWISYEKYLKVNTAIPFFLPRDDNNLNTRTKAITMKYGWMWMAPVHNRWGCGYVFDRNMVSEEDAAKEIEEYLGHSFQSPKTFYFNSGYYENVWIKNCLAIGLSSGFLEPMEATSLMTVLIQLKLLLKHFPNKNIEEFNKYIKSVNDQNMWFVYYHYMCDRKDTEFWKFYNDGKNMPKGLLKIYDENLNFKFNSNSKEYEKQFLDSEPVYTTRSWHLVNGGNKMKTGNLI